MEMLWSKKAIFLNIKLEELYYLMRFTMKLMKMGVTGEKMPIETRMSQRPTYTQSTMDKGSRLLNGESTT